MKTRFALVAVCLGSLTLPLSADDWPQYRGLNRDARSKEVGLAKKWPDKGPPFVWTFEQVGLGYSSPAIVGDRLYIMGARGGSEFLIALDIKDKPKELWTVKIGPIFTWKGNNWNTGPNATPSVDKDSGLIFALGGQGILICVDTEGKEKWRKDLPAEMGAEVNPVGGGAEKLGWGFAWSPLVDGDQLVIIPGSKQGEIAALNKKDGKVLWQTKELTNQATYASPVVAEIGGVRQYLQVTFDNEVGVAGVAAKDGKLLWHYKKKASFTDCVIPTPIVHDGLVYFTVGFSFGCDLVKVSGKESAFTAEEVPAYKPNKIFKSMQNQSGGVVLVDDHVYGYSDGKGWVCQNLKTGATAWSEKQKLGRGSLIYADGHLYCYGEDDGVVVLLDASPKGWSEKGRFVIPKKSDQNLKSGKLWTHPILANGKLYLRDQELLFCFDAK